MRTRVQARAAELGLRCGTLLVLSAVLELLLGWKRVRDDGVAIGHVAAHFPAGARVLSATTIGRLLAKLAACELIVYRPARGRGCGAHVAIHPQFLDGVSELARDSRGRVITDASRANHETKPAPDSGADPGVGPGSESGENVKFSRDRFLIGPLGPTTSQPSAAHEPVDDRAGRPTEVAVDPQAVRMVLAELPQCYRSAPRWVRWHLGAAIKAQLARGWREDQIIAVLAAPVPDQVRKPLVLARWRLTHNMLGAGPRLQPLQAAWDQAHAATARARFVGQRAGDCARLTAELGEVLCRHMADCAQQRATTWLGTRAQPTTPEDQQARYEAAVVHAARMARRQHPQRSLKGAVTAWLAAHHTPTPTPTPQPIQPPPQRSTQPARDLTVSDLIAATPAGRCVSCGSIGAITREELPLPAPVCADCWAQHADEPDAVDEPVSAVAGIGVASIEPEPTSQAC